MAQGGFTIEVVPEPSAAAPAAPTALPSRPAAEPFRTSGPTPVVPMPRNPIPSPAVTPTPVPTSGPTPTPAVVPPPPGTLKIVAITPRPEECKAQSPCAVTVLFTWVPGADQSALKPYVLVRPLPDDPAQQYFAQTLPAPGVAGQWSSRDVYVGQPGDARMPFRICAVATEQTLRAGDALHSLPGGPSDCVVLTRAEQ